jgi:aspartate/methionine/tyrosine aminotransferase
LRSNPINPALLAGIAQPSDRSDVSSFVVMDVMRRAFERERAGGDIIHMEVGQPGTPAPRLAREAIKQAMDRELLGYTDALGIPALRERIALYYKEQHNLNVAPERIVVTAGSSAGFVLAFLALFDQGGRIFLPEPGYPCYRNIAKALGLIPVPVEVGPDERWMPTAELLERVTAQTGGAEALLFASPANPTGTMMTPQNLAAICDWCRTNRVAVISDEIYHGLTYGAPAETALSFDQDAVIINSFSKYYSMTGWRVGWMVVPENLTRTIERLAQNLYVSASAASQAGALAAFDAVEELEANRVAYAKNHAMLMEELPRAGFTNLAPADGAFYVYADISDRTDDSRGFAARILDELGVAVTPGVDFDPGRGLRYLRFSYAGSFEAMREATRRLQNWKG